MMLVALATKPTEPVLPWVGFLCELFQGKEAKEYRVRSKAFMDNGSAWDWLREQTDDQTALLARRGVCLVARSHYQMLVMQTQDAWTMSPSTLNGIAAVERDVLAAVIAEAYKH